MKAKQAIENIKEHGFTPIDPPTFGELFRAGYFDGPGHEEDEKTEAWLAELAAGGLRPAKSHEAGWYMLGPAGPNDWRWITE